jgi:hypothetical protein
VKRPPERRTLPAAAALVAAAAGMLAAKPATGDPEPAARELSIVTFQQGDRKR